MATSITVPDDVSSLVDHAKRPVTRVAGPYGHPFHPILVTVPIGAWVSSVVFDVASRVKSGGSQHLAYASYWLIVIGLVGAVCAALFGLIDLTRLARRTPALRLGLTHLVLNLVVVAMFAIDLVARHGSYDVQPRVGGGQLTLSVVALVVLAVSGWIGGKLAFRYGVRVAHEIDQVEALTPS